jgi:hypothetical protein
MVASEPANHDSGLVPAERLSQSYLPVDKLQRGWILPVYQHMRGGRDNKRGLEDSTEMHSYRRGVNTTEGRSPEAPKTGRPNYFK